MATTESGSHEAHLSSWYGLSVWQARQRSAGGSAGMAPPMPVRFMTAEPLSIPKFKRDAQRACQAMQAVLEEASRAQAMHTHTVESLDVSDLREPGPSDILTATTFEHLIETAAPSPVPQRLPPAKPNRGGGRRAAGRDPAAGAGTHASETATTAAAGAPEAVTAAAAKRGGAARGGKTLAGKRARKMPDQLQAGVTDKAPQKAGATPAEDAERVVQDPSTAPAAAAEGTTATETAATGAAAEGTTTAETAASTGTAGTGTGAAAQIAAQSAAATATAGTAVTAAAVTEAAEGTGAAAAVATAAKRGSAARGSQGQVSKRARKMPDRLQAVVADKATQKAGATPAHEAAPVAPDATISPAVAAEGNTAAKTAGAAAAADTAAAAAGTAANTAAAAAGTAAATATAATEPAAAETAATELTPAAAAAAAGTAPREAPAAAATEPTPAADGVWAAGAAEPATNSGGAPVAAAPSPTVVRKAAQDITPAEWAELYRSHAWVYDTLAVLPPGAAAAAAAPSMPAATVLGQELPGATMADQPDHQQQQQQQQQLTADQLQPQQEKQEQEQSAFQQPQQRQGSALITLPNGLDVLPSLVSQWQARFATASKHLASLRSLEAGYGAGPGQFNGMDVMGRPIRRPAKMRQASDGGVPVSVRLMREAAAARPSPTPTPPATSQGLQASRLRGFTSSLAGPVQRGSAAQTAQDASSPDEIDWRNEVLVTVCVYAPRRSDVVDDEFVLLGSQSLSALADRIHCVSKLNLESVGAQGSGGAYLFIQGCFFNDTRDPHAIDLSAPIIDLCKAQGVVPCHMDVRPGDRNIVYQKNSRAQQLGGAEATSRQQQQQQQQQQAAAEPAAGGPRQSAQTAAQAASQWSAKAGPGEVSPEQRQGEEEDLQPANAAIAAEMQHTRFDRLAVHLSNEPMYIFNHLGCCEHQIQVRDVRRMHPDDPRQRSAYPLLLMHPHRLPRPKRRCDVCEMNDTEHVAYNDPLAPANPTFYCRRCLGLLHPEGVPNGTHVYPFIATGVA